MPDGNDNPDRAELERRIGRLVESLNHSATPFDTALIVGRINQYYLTGTMQDGLLIVRRDGTITFYVRKSARRAQIESPLPIIREMNTYKDILKHEPAHLGHVWIETNIMTVEVLERLKRTFVFDQIHPIESVLASLRAVKSPSEITLIREAGRRHSMLLETIVPQLMHTGISEAEFCQHVYAAMMNAGHHGVSRFSMFQMEMSIGQVGFGDSSIYPTSFDGPGGMRGLSAAVPSMAAGRGI
jgi:Xaa-Pro aminopeptidase